jgi:membrane-bound serine protease (ClpP class)
MKTKSHLFRILWISLFAATLLLPFLTAHAQGDAPGPAVVLTHKGPISPVLIEYLKRGLRIAQDKGAGLVVFELDTPGGQIDIMEEIVQIIRSNPIPVVVYVSPRNGMAASAGTIITLAGHLSAMAPETTIGAASPVGSQGEDIGQTMEAKTKEALKASVRGLMQNRSADAVLLAESMIQDAKAVTVDEAIQVGLVDIKAVDINDLLNQLDGRIVQVGEGEITLHTANMQVLTINNTFIEEILLTLVNPNLVFILLSLGVQAILIEISSPGGWVAGFVGVVCLLLAIYGIGILPVNWFGMLFVIVAFVLFILDIKAPTHGALTAAGGISFIVGALVLFNSVRVPGLPRISVPLVISTGAFIAAIFFAVMTFAVRAQSVPVLTGKEAMLGRMGSIYGFSDNNLLVKVGGELWAAELKEGERLLEEGARVQVVGVRGLHLIVGRETMPKQVYVVTPGVEGEKLERELLKRRRKGGVG